MSHGGREALKEGEVFLEEGVPASSAVSQGESQGTGRAGGGELRRVCIRDPGAVGGAGCKAKATNII